MLLAKVVGNIVATQKAPRLQGMKLLCLQPCVPQGEGFIPSGATLVAVDFLGAGEGAFVLVTQGSSARLAQNQKDCPVDAVIVGIVDQAEMGGKPLEKP
jgi:microcompartment protein CcmK/EutM